jgi:UrcA family protein
MSIQSHLTSKLKVAALAASVGAIVASTAASAQDYDRGGASDTTETIRVYAPRALRVERQPQNGPVEKISMSRSVRYDDLDLRTRFGAHELRMRVDKAAADICSQLSDINRVPEQPGTSCYQSARQDALLRANAAIRDARSY